MMKVVDEVLPWPYDGSTSRAGLKSDGNKYENGW